MRQILQSFRSGETQLVEVPVPAVTANSIVVETRASVLSSGTERMLVEFGRANLLEKARQQPHRVGQVLQKARTDGLFPTLEAVRSKLAEPVPLGYCQAGIVREVGSSVEGFSVGDGVATNGNHAEYVRVPWTLAARIPVGVPFGAAAFAPLAAIGLQGLRLAKPTLGETVVVYGLGLIGLLTVQLARAHGCHVIGIDPMQDRLSLAETFGAVTIRVGDESDVVAQVRSHTGNLGADAVLLTLSTEADEPVHLASDMCRKRGRLVLVGVTGLQLRREDFYEKELSFQVSCSYGPGRYDASHEEGGTDYPLPFVRWTEGRNFQAVLDLMADGRLDPIPLVTHRISFAEAPSAYEVITGGKPSLGVVLEYEEKEPAGLVLGRTLDIRGEFEPGTTAARGNSVVGFIGAGNFAQRVLMPSFKAAGATLHTVVSSKGTSASVAARRLGFSRASTDPEVVFADPAIDAVIIATRHDTHADFVLRALEAGKHVFVEKPLAIRREDVDRIEEALGSTDRVLCVGFNRRFAPHTREALRILEGRTGPLAINITVNAGELPPGHWTKDPEIGGGRLVGEACHFIDLARCLTGHPIKALSVTSAGGINNVGLEDVSHLQLSFEDGSIGTVQYLANGPRSFPKERIEVFWDGRAFRIDNFRRFEGWGFKMASGGRLRRQDKGHQALVEAFLTTCRDGGPPPIPAPELLEVARLLLEGRWS